MTYQYTYREHKYYKQLYYGLQNYLVDMEYGEDVPDEIAKYRAYLLERHNPNPMSVLDFIYIYPNSYSDYSICDEDSRYPSEQFLISLSETILQITAEKYRQIMGKVVDAWYDFCMPDSFIDADEETLTYKLYTGGWSGNENIIDALLSNISISPAMDVHNDGAVWTFKYRLLDGPQK